MLVNQKSDWVQYYPNVLGNCRYQSTPNISQEQLLSYFLRFPKAIQTRILSQCSNDDLPARMKNLLSECFNSCRYNSLAPENDTPLDLSFHRHGIRTAASDRVNNKTHNTKMLFQNHQSNGYDTISDNYLTQRRFLNDNNMDSMDYSTSNISNHPASYQNANNHFASFLNKRESHMASLNANRQQSSSRHSIEIPATRYSDVRENKRSKMTYRKKYHWLNSLNTIFLQDEAVADENEVSTEKSAVEHSSRNNTDCSSPYQSKMDKGPIGPSLTHSTPNPFKMTPTDSWPCDGPDHSTRPVLAPPKFGAISGGMHKKNTWGSYSALSSKGPPPPFGSIASGLEPRSSSSSFRFKPAVLSGTVAQSSTSNSSCKRPAEQDGGSDDEKTEEIGCTDPNEGPTSTDAGTDSKKLRVSSTSGGDLDQEESQSEQPVSNVPSQEHNELTTGSNDNPFSADSSSIVSDGGASGSETVSQNTSLLGSERSSTSSVAAPMFVPLTTKKETPKKKEETTPSLVNGVSTPSSPPLASKSAGSGFIFGQNLHSKVSGLDSVSNGETSHSCPLSANPFASAVSSLAAAAAAAPSPGDGSSVGASGGGKSLSETSRELSLKRESLRTKYEEVEVITGEENEKNVIQMNCKLYSWTNSTWQERGRGILRLNDREIRDELHSRLVVRTQGTLTVMLNTKIWSEMSVEKPNDKTVRFTASGTDGQPKIYLVVGSAKDVTLLHNSLEYRVAAARSQSLDERDLDNDDDDSLASLPV